ncbi:hypothetical protein, partial [Alsobacter sp. SYSU BS001988]
ATVRSPIIASPPSRTTESGLHPRSNANFFNGIGAKRTLASGLQNGRSGVLSVMDEQELLAAPAEGAVQRLPHQTS